MVNWALHGRFDEELLAVKSWDEPQRYPHSFPTCGTQKGLRLRRRARRGGVVRMDAAATATERIDHPNRVDFEGGL